jgi:hypothetical protein
MNRSLQKLLADMVTALSSRQRIGTLEERSCETGNPDDVHVTSLEAGRPKLAPHTCFPQTINWRTKSCGRPGYRTGRSSETDANDQLRTNLSILPRRGISRNRYTPPQTAIPDWKQWAHSRDPVVSPAGVPVGQWRRASSKHNSAHPIDGPYQRKARWLISRRARL